MIMSKQVHTCTAFCFALVAILATFVFVEGLPILGPDISNCQPVIPIGRSADDAVDCCFPDTIRSIKDFQFNLDLPVRVRRPAHKVDDEFIRKYERAVELMKALPPEDPRSFEMQAKLHCAYCGGAYREFNSTVTMNVHTGWLLLPFHRWFIYFHERILASLICDDSFALPYWAWDVQQENNPPANSIPLYYTNRNSSLYDDHRSILHQPPARVDLGQEHSAHPTTNKDPDVLLEDNSYYMWRAMISQVRTPEAFLGAKVSLGSDPDEIDQGILGLTIHNAAHFWTGDSNNRAGEDMGLLFSGAWDPIFFAHHAQIDRLWLMWKSWGGKDFDDPDFLETEFLFYDENADLVRVNIRDSLSNENFRVRYEQVYPDWVDHTPKSIRDIDPKYAQASILSQLWHQLIAGDTYRNIALALGSFFQQDTNGANIVIAGASRRGAVSLQVSRPEVLRSKFDSSFYDEVLVIRGVVEMPFNVSVLMNIFLELPEADESTPKHCVEFLGSVELIGEGLRVGMDKTIARKFTKVIGIRDALQILGVSREKSLTVTFVPGWFPKHDSTVSFGVTDLKVEMKPTR
ncbi:unnamed protein product [Calypogeia fissa]